MKMFCRMPEYIYSNPVTDNLQIQTTFQINEIAITDIAGKLLYTTSYKTINCSSFAKGVYFLIQIGAFKIIN